MFNVRLAGCHLYGKQLFTWLSLVVSLMASFVLSFFPLDVLDEIWDLIEPVSEGFLTYSYYTILDNYCIVVGDRMKNIVNTKLIKESYYGLSCLCTCLSVQKSLTLALIVDVSVTRFSCCYKTHGVLYRVPTSDFVGIVYSGYIHRINVAFILSK